MIGFGLRISLVIPLALALGACMTTQSDFETPDPVVQEAVPDETIVEAVERGHEALEQDRFESALTIFQQVLRSRPDHAQAKLGSAESYLGLGLYEEAVRAFREAGSDPEVGVAALQGKGIALLVMGESDSAYEALNAAVDERPDLWRAWNAIARYHDDRAEWDRADAAYDTSAAAAPSKSVGSVLNNWGVSKMARGDYSGAADLFERALVTDDSLDTARTNLRLSLAFQGRYAEAMSGVGQKEKPGMLNNIGFVAMMKGDHARAEAYFLRALESSPRFNEAASKNLELLASMKQVRISTENEGVLGSAQE